MQTWWKWRFHPPGLLEEAFELNGSSDVMFSGEFIGDCIIRFHDKDDEFVYDVIVATFWVGLHPATAEDMFLDVGVEPVDGDMRYHQYRDCWIPIDPDAPFIQNMGALQPAIDFVEELEEGRQYVFTLPVEFTGVNAQYNDDPDWRRALDYHAELAQFVKGELTETPQWDPPPSWPTANGETFPFVWRFYDVPLCPLGFAG